MVPIAKWMRNNLPFEVVTKTKQIVSNSKSFKRQTLQHVLQVNSLAFFSILCKYGSESILTYSSFISVRHMLEFRHRFHTFRLAMTEPWPFGQYTLPLKIEIHNNFGIVTWDHLETQETSHTLKVRAFFIVLHSNLHLPLLTLT